MKKILLAIDGITPNKKTVHYAVELCKRIKAELNILQIINSLNLGERVNRVRRYMEDSMIAATFAEAGEHEMAKDLREQALKNINRLIPESEKEAVHCHLSVRSGNPDKEIVNYVNDHRDIVLTIYNTPKEEMADADNEKNRRDVPRLIRQRLSTPLVVVRG
jgi:nucleotide-binding universal stress UspA family protein